MADPTMTTSKPPLPWWADPNDPRYKWMRTNTSYAAGNPTGVVEPGDTGYQNWLTQNFQSTNNADPLRSPPSAMTASSSAASTPTNTYTPTTYTDPQAQAASYQAATGATPGVAAAGNSNTTQPGQGDVWDGFARRYAPGQRDTLFGPLGPQIILEDYLNQDGRNNYLNMQGDLGRYAQVAPEIYNLLIGGNMDPAANKDDAIINWMANLFQQQSTEGGRSPEVSQMLAQMFAGLADETSDLYAQGMLNSYGQPATTTEQIYQINEMIPLLGTFTGNARYTDSMKRQAQRLGNEYAQRVANGEANGQTYAQYLQANFLR